MSNQASKRVLGRTSATAERRADPRQQFTVAAEVVELNTGVRFSSRTSDLGLGGCYVDTLSALADGTMVRLRLAKGNAHIETTGKVLYSHRGQGMGIGFAELTPEQQTVLKSWLSEADREDDLGSEPPPVAKPEKQSSSAELRLMLKLVQILIRKGILTESEGTALLHDILI